MGAPVKACVKVITTRTGTGVQTITGIVDRSGSPFVPTLVLFQSGNTALNAVSYQDSVNNACADDRGADDGTSRMSSGLADISRFGLKLACIGIGPSYSILDVQADIFFGGNLQGHASVTAFRLGECDITFDLNNRGGDSVMCAFLGGDDFEVDYGYGLTNGVMATTAQPAALFNVGSLQAMTSAGGGASTSAGGSSLGYGWDTNGSGRGAAVYEVINQGGNGRGQLTDRCGVSLGSGSFGAAAPVVSSWDANSLTIAGSVAGANYASFAFSGARLAARALAFTQPTEPGPQTINIGINAKWVVLAAVGIEASASPSTDRAEFAIGWTDGARQGGFWCGEATNGNAGALTGARYLSDETLLRFGVPNAGTTTFDAIAELVSLSAAGELVINWPTVDGTPRQVLLFALGQAAGVVDQPVEYEDPCDIRDPILYAKVRTETDTYKVSVRPLRERLVQGGFGVPRLVEVSPIQKAGSDPFTGDWSAQSVTLRNGDTDRVMRALSDSRTSLRNCDAEVYLTSKDQSRAIGPPRLLFAGKVLQDAADQNLVHGLEINDPIGVDYTVTGEERTLPERTVQIPHFPGAPADSIGKGEKPRVGRFAPLNPANGEGVVEGIRVGLLTIGGSAGTPTGITLADLVAALQTSKDAGTLYVDWGSTFGYADVTSLQNYSGAVPSDYDQLVYGVGSFIGLGKDDVDFYLKGTTVTGGTQYYGVLFAAHAIKQFLTTTTTSGGPSIWINDGTTDTAIDPAELGVSVWAPQIAGDTTWSSEFGSDKFTDILGTDGVTRRYTLVLFDPASPYGIAVAAGARVHADFIGAETDGDGNGTAITDYFDAYLWLLKNVLLQTYYSGAYLASPTFLFADGITELSRINEDSFTAAKAVWMLTLPEGLQASITLEDGATRRTVTKDLNFNGGCVQGYDDFGRFFVKVLDRRRSQFYLMPDGTTHRVLDGKRDILPGMNVTGKPDWQVNLLVPEYARNYYTGTFERTATGGASPIQDTESQARDGVLKKTFQFNFLRDDLSAQAVGQYYVALFGNLPYVVKYARRGLCGLEDDIWQGVPMTHWNGFGPDGYVAKGLWVMTRSFLSEMYCQFTALYVDHKLDAEDPPAARYIVSDPVALEQIIADGTGELVIAD